MARKIVLIVYSFLLVSCNKAMEEIKFPINLSKDFNICDRWQDGMTWADFQAIRTNLERPSLIRYVDKIQANKMLKERGIPVIPVIYASNSKDPIVPIIEKLNSYVAKPSHMSHNTGLIIYQNGFDLVSKKRITAMAVEERMHKLIDTPTNSDEWVLRNIPRGFLIQEFIKKRQELKIQTIWGQPREIVWVQGGDPMILNNYDIFLNPLGNSSPLPFSKQLIENAKKIAEKVSLGTDALRVDIMVRFNDDGSQDLLVNELELRSALRFVQHQEMAQLLNDGYRKVCKN